MSEQVQPIKWAELTPDERNRLIAEKVLGYPLSQAKERFTVPPYTQNMDLAWLVLRRMCDEAEWTERMMLFINYLDGEYEAVDKNATRLEPIFTLTQLASLTPEKICLAALRASGVEVSYE